MLTLLFFEAYILSRWRTVSIHFFWAKVISLVFPVLLPVPDHDRCSSYLKKCRVRNRFPEAEVVEKELSFCSNSVNSPTSPFLVIMSIEETFRAAVKVIHSLPKDGPYQPSNGTKLKFYGLFKQATDGPCNIPKPAFYDIIGRYKWDAWNKLGNLGKEEAMLAYVDGLKDIIETMSFNGEVEDFLDSIGPFYEFINLHGSKMNHIKEKVDQFTSSSGSGSGSSSSSSNSNSIQTSPLNSSPSSPVKNLQIPSSKVILEEGNVNEDGEEQVHVKVDEKTATYEAIVLKSSVQQNSNGHSQSESLNKSQRHPTPRTQDFDSNSIVPPPTPMHTYARTNGFLPNKHANSSSNSSLRNSHSKGITEDFDGEELIQLESNGDASIGASCKEDLEQDPNDFDYGNYQTATNHHNHEKLQNTASIDTLATSGTESEKYYSGDSEPEVDERFMTYYSQTNPANNSNGSPIAGCSKAIPYTQINGIPVSRTQLTVANSETDSKFQSKDKGVSSFNKRSRSPKVNGGLNQFFSAGYSKGSLDPAAAGELVIQSAVERLNRDVDHILARLRILETAYATTAEQGIAGQTRNGNRRKTFLGGLSKTSLAFIVMWPFIVHFIIRLLSWWWRRRRMTRVLTKALTR